MGGDLSGGTLAGSLTVTVLNAMSGGPVPEAFVFVNNDPRATPPSSGRTNMGGQVTLSPPMLTAPVTVTAAKDCFTTTTIQSFDASNATIYLTPLMLPRCGMGMPMGMPQRPVFPGRVKGELIWAGPNEFAPNPWVNVPEPRAGERRVAYVYATRPDIFTPRLRFEATRAQLDERVPEVVPGGYSARGILDSCSMRPGAIAIYALAGVERSIPVPGMAPMVTRVFTPYMMGVARNVLASPVNPMTPTEGVVDNLVINMNVPLDHVTPLEVEPYPVAMGETTPNVFPASAFIDLKRGEGVIPRPGTTVTGRRGQVVHLRGPPGLLWRARRCAAQDPRARYAWGTVTGPATFQDMPGALLGLILGGITTPDETVRVRNWMGIPDITAPMQGGALPADRNVRFGINPMLVFALDETSSSSPGAPARAVAAPRARPRAGDPVPRPLDGDGPRGHPARLAPHALARRRAHPGLRLQPLHLRDHQPGLLERVRGPRDLRHALTGAPHDPAAPSEKHFMKNALRFPPIPTLLLASMAACSGPTREADAGLSADVLEDRIIITTDVDRLRWAECNVGQQRCASGTQVHQRCVAAGEPPAWSRRTATAEGGGPPRDRAGPDRPARAPRRGEVTVPPA